MWGKSSIWALLCGNGELKLASRLAEEQLSLDHLKEANRAERGLSMEVQKPRRCWGIGSSHSYGQRTGDTLTNDQLNWPMIEVRG